MHRLALNVCGSLVDLSTTIKGSTLKLVLQNTVRPLFDINFLAGILTDPEEESKEKKEPVLAEMVYAAIYKDCTPSPAMLK